MLFERKIYQKFIAWKNEAQGHKALLVEGARRIGGVYVIHLKNLIQKDDILCIPPYMTICL